MGSITIGVPEPDKTTAFVDECWRVTVNINPCWEVSVTEKPCWEVEGKDMTIQNPNPIFDNDLDLSKEGVFNIFAIHIVMDEIYMAVEMRSPDDPETQTYWDAYGSATEQRADGKWVYHPPYKATQIVEVSDIVSGLLPHTVETDEQGYKFIVMDDIDINFDVYYKMDHGFRLLKGVLSDDFSSQTMYMDWVENSVEVSPTLIGSGCFIMGHEDIDQTTPLVFKAKNDSLYSIDRTTLELTPLSTTGINYMLSPELALKPESTSRFNITTGTGEADAYPTNIFGRSNSFVFDVMQNENETLGFPIYDPADFNSLKNIKVALGLKYYWFQQAYDSGFGGVGNTGSILSTKPFNPDLYLLSSIPYVPNPIPPVSPYLASDVLLGMTPPDYRVTDGFELVGNVRMSTSMIKINAGSNFLISTGTEILYLVSHYPDKYPYSSMTIYKICDVTDVEDYCVWNGIVYVTTGTSQIKAYNTLSML